MALPLRGSKTFEGGKINEMQEFSASLSFFSNRKNIAKVYFIYTDKDYLKFPKQTVHS